MHFYFMENSPLNAKSFQAGDGDLDDDDDEEKYADNADMPGTKVDSKQRITVRNLRIREDTAKVIYIIFMILYFLMIFIYFPFVIFAINNIEIKVKGVSPFLTWK